jgi:N-acetylmuramoyl-L-alanine amidase
VDKELRNFIAGRWSDSAGDRRADLIDPSTGEVFASAPAPALPSAPAANLQGRFSLSRQLGLGIARIVIDAGHGGHDPGAQSKGLSEAELVLDVALRLEQLLLKQPGVEVVLTRRSDVFIPLEERTAIANREGADLFLSIHANASRNAHARGVETYFLNFASNPDAEAVAARENAASGRTMHSLPDIVKAITLSDKLDESRDFATLVQRSMVLRLAVSNKGLRDLGVKQAPFVVLIGAAMPSVLAEISFVTHPQEGRLLKAGAYRQKIAEALFDGVAQYQRSLKNVRTIATAPTR